MNKVILWGTGESTNLLEYYLKKENLYEISGYTMDREYINEKVFNSKPVVPFDEIEKYFSPKAYKLGIFMSAKNLNRLREEKYLEGKKKGYSFINYISKYAYCEAQSIGENVYILPDASIQPFCNIGNNIIMWSTTVLGHHIDIANNCFLASPKISGFCKIGKNCFLGTNSTLADHVKIGDYSIIGAGAVVTKNVKEGSVLAVKQTSKLEMSSFELESFVS